MFVVLSVIKTVLELYRLDLLQLCSNKLTLNLTKTKYIIFMPRQKESCNLYPPLTVANVYLEKSSCVKHLGVYDWSLQNVTLHNIKSFAVSSSRSLRAMWANYPKFEFIRTVSE